MESVLPKVETKLDVEKESEYSATLRAYPSIPEKCKGKKVKLTPMNKRIKKEIANGAFNTNPVKSGYHNVIPVKIPNTAPNLST